MVNKGNLTPVSKEDEINEILILGIKEQIQVFIIDKMTGYPRLLSPSHLATIRQATPDKTTLIFERPMPGSSIEEWKHPMVCGDYGHQDLWVEQKVYDGFFNQTNKITSKIDGNNLNIIGLLLKTMLGTTPAGKKISCFESQTAIIDYLTSNFPNVTGISKSNLENKFSKANQLIK